MSEKTAPISRHSILIADDIEMNRSLICRIFRDLYTVYTAENGQEAMQMLHQHRIDLVLLDINMPVMDGFEVMQAMKQDDVLADIPIVVITGEVERAEKKALEFGADDFIHKPYDVFIIQKRVGNLIERNEYHKMREFLREQQRNHDLFDLLGIAYWEWSRLGGYDHSGEYERYAISEIQPEMIWDGMTPYQYVHPDDAELMKAFMQPNPEDETRKSAIVRCKMKDGSYQWTEMFSMAEEAPDGQLERLVSIMRDVDQEWLNQKKQLEAALVQAQSANKMKSKFLSRVSHDMRTPLNVILSLAALAPVERPAYDTLLAYFHSITEEGSFLLRLINDVLDMQKIELDTAMLHPVPIGMDELMEPVICAVKTLAKEKSIDFSITVKDFLDDAKATLDPLRVQQLMTNLLTNAVKYTQEHGRVELLLEHLDFTDGITTDRITIRDNGCGMSSAFMEQMYSPFTQEHGGSRSTTRGTGLGLAIVKKIVDLMDGKITCTSEIGKGTTFQIVLKTPLTVQQNQQSSGKLNLKLSGDLSMAGRRILLCEDHPMNALIATKILKQKGIIVTHAENGQAGLDDFCQSEPNYYDAILMDVRMPVMNGLETTKAIRALARTDAGRIPIIAMTANALKEDVEACIAAGMNAHLAKPIDTAMLWETIYRLIDSSKQIAKLKVIVVDDIEANAAVVAEAIRSQYEPICVSSGAEALKQLALNSDTVAVITDIMMPEMDGHELITAIRGNPVYDSIVILANTSYGEKDNEELVLQDGADDYIYKPTTPAVVLKRLENALKRRNQRA